jgi:hypothetical protein
LISTKIDPKVASLVISEMLTLQTITLHSEYCDKKEVPNFYERIHVLGRADPAEGSKQKEKDIKISHRPNDMY